MADEDPDGGDLGVAFRFAAVFGLRLRARARFSREESEAKSESWSSGMAEGDVCRLAAADRVIGAK